MMVWIKCPERGRAVPTGIDVHPTCFAMMPEAVGGFTCAACGQRHEWRRKDAWLAETYPLLPDRRFLNDGAASHYRPRGDTGRLFVHGPTSQSIN